MLRVYTVFDKAANLFSGSALMLFPADAAAIRMFDDACMNRQSTIGRYPMDHELVYLGTFNPETGELLQDGPRVIREGTRYPETQVGQMEEAMNGLAPDPLQTVGL